MKRLFYVAFGATAGVLVVRRATSAAQRWTPEGLVDQAGGAGAAAAAWWSEVKVYAAQRELELRAALGLDSDDSDDRSAA